MITVHHTTSSRTEYRADWLQTLLRESSWWLKSLTIALQSCLCALWLVLTPYAMVKAAIPTLPITHNAIIDMPLCDFKSDPHPIANTVCLKPWPTQWTVSLRMCSTRASHLRRCFPVSFSSTRERLSWPPQLVATSHTVSWWLSVTITSKSTSTRKPTTVPQGMWRASSCPWHATLKFVFLFFLWSTWTYRSAQVGLGLFGLPADGLGSHLAQIIRVKWCTEAASPAWLDRIPGGLTRTPC